MRYWTQQAIILAVGIGAAIAAEGIYGGVEIKIQGPNGHFFLVWLFQFSLAVFTCRLLRWSAWDSPLISKAFEAMRMDRDATADGWRGTFKRWWFHIDRNGSDLDARTR